MAQKFYNNARATLASQMDASDLQLLLTSGAGDSFPPATVGPLSIDSGGDWFKVTLTNLTDVLDPPVDVQWEIVYVRTRNAGADIMSNIIRAQEGTIARTWAAGTVIRIALTAMDVEATVAKTWNTVPVVAAASGYAMTRADVGKCYKATASLELPAGVFEVDDVVSIYNHTGGSITLTPAGGITMWWDDGLSGARTLTTRAICTLICVEANEFRIAGSGLR